MYHPDDERAVLAEEWTQWSIAAGEFADAGVDLTAISAMILGVGDRTNLRTGGAGVLYFDDIQAVRRMPATDMVVLLAEDFEGLSLDPNVDESVAGDAVWTSVAPEGWTRDNSGVPSARDSAHGVDEWEGWTFADHDWWALVAGDQRRSEFALAIGTIAVADSDEYDDKGDPQGTYNAFLTTPEIDVSGIEAGNGTIVLRFDSSWRPEYDNDYHQTANITAAFDDGEPIEVLRWESDPTSSNYKDDNSTNETITINLDNPAGARKVVLTFGLFDAGNDWWWAIDNVEVIGTFSE